MQQFLRGASTITATSPACDPAPAGLDAQPPGPSPAFRPGCASALTAVTEYLHGALAQLHVPLSELLAP